MASDDNQFHRRENRKISERIIGYLTETYQPDAIIIYGSYADGSVNENSDFDALVIAKSVRKHDTSVIGNTVLDVFVYPEEVFQSDYDPEEFVQVFDGIVILDKTGAAARLKRTILAYLENAPRKTDDEIRQELDWCEKMLHRTMRGDSEGYYRWHWVLCDSLEIYCDVKGLAYHGPKKALRTIAQTDETAYQIYSRALKEFNREYLSEWITYLKHLNCN